MSKYTTAAAQVCKTTSQNTQICSIYSITLNSISKISNGQYKISLDYQRGLEPVYSAGAIEIYVNGTMVKSAQPGFSPNKKTYTTTVNASVGDTIKMAVSLANGSHSSISRKLSKKSTGAFGLTKEQLLIAGGVGIGAIALLSNRQRKQ